MQHVVGSPLTLASRRPPASQRPHPLPRLPCPAPAVPAKGSGPGGGGRPGAELQLHTPQHLRRAVGAQAAQGGAGARGARHHPAAAPPVAAAPTVPGGTGGAGARAGHPTPGGGRAPGAGLGKRAGHGLPQRGGGAREAGPPARGARVVHAVCAGVPVCVRVCGCGCVLLGAAPRGHGWRCQWMARQGKAWAALAAGRWQVAGRGLSLRLVADRRCCSTVGCPPALAAPT